MIKYVSALSGTAALLVLATTPLAAHAEALWDPYLRGAEVGNPSGALPPPGVYAFLDNYVPVYTYFDSSGHKVPGTQLNGLIEVPGVLWVIEPHILGASYALGIVQPFDYTVSAGLSHSVGGGNLGTYNTILVPAELSWALPHGLFISTGLKVHLPDSSSTLNGLETGKLANGGLPSGNGHATMQPDFGLSLLTGGWNISVGVHITLPITDDVWNNVHYHSGDEIALDYTVTKRLGAWTLGVGGEQENQFTPDTINGQSQIGVGRSNANFGLGPIVGYDFKNFDVQAMWIHNIVTRNDVAGDFFNIRLTHAF
ncbi:transporter [Acidocella sp. KAb 2-4]|uniref:SphA family protein n=1 Tax=Acidocella sp. KAb 2-4 TaxID=2885158 RepID=UPI001D094E78|nr:transporter [Acidocella sp. KAb 2-4]MCB5944220.1 transporter [Acidocella sp. KAb 2-4]